MPPLSNAEKLKILDHSGLRIDEEGRISNWLDQPPQHPRPIGQSDGKSNTTRRQFTAEEDEMLKKWCTAAELEGVKGNSVFEQFEAVCPNHPWQAYQTRWRRKLKSTAMPKVTADSPYPGLDRIYPSDVSAEDDPESSLDITDQDLEEAAKVSYNDFRVDSDRVIFNKLGVKDENELRQLLQSPWVIKVYSEFCAGIRAEDLSLRCLSAEPGANSNNHSPHQWKFTQALCVLELPGNDSRYGSHGSKLTSWTEDDHDIHFIVLAARLGSERGQIWCEDRRLHGWKGPCWSALWLLLWFKWIRRTTTGQSSWSQRIQRKREIWLSFLENLLTRPSFFSDDGGAERTVRPTGRTSHETSNHSQSRQKTDQQLFLLSTHARDLYLRNRDKRLSAWGVGTKHEGSCILVPAAWSTTDPIAMVEHSEAWPIDEPRTSRLYLPMGAFTFPWARAAAWFEHWPRTTEELQHFVPPNNCRHASSDMHGSHLCHHGLCINPVHIAYEDKAKNLSRNSCSNTATVLRSYGANIPKHCSKHDPPCLLQSAALTTFETFAIQFNILRIARDADGRDPYPQPVSHPSQYLTFEQGPMASTAFPDIGITVSSIVRLPHQTGLDDQRGFHWRCPLCTYPRTFGRITSFWAHIKTGHQDSERNVILQEVTRSAQANQAWAYQHFYHYERQNPTTWQKLQQAQAADFTWEVFAGWRLSRERHYQGRKE